MLYNSDEHYEIEYFDVDDYEAARRKDSARLHQQTIRTMENRYGCTFPEFILRVQTSEERSDLQQWSLAIRSLARYEEKMYI